MDVLLALSVAVSIPSFKLRSKHTLASSVSCLLSNCRIGYKLSG